MPDSFGFDRRTGARLEGWPHVQQSIEVLFTTRIGSRIMRREVGAELMDLVGRPQTERVLLAVYAAAKLGLAAYEPRFDIVRCILKPAADGAPALDLAGIYLPRGHLGDRTPARGDGLRETTVGLIAGGLR